MLRKFGAVYPLRELAEKRSRNFVVFPKGVKAALPSRCIK